MMYLFRRLRSNRLRRCTSNVKDCSFIDNIGSVRTGVSSTCGLDFEVDWFDIANACSTAMPEQLEMLF